MTEIGEALEGEWAALALLSRAARAVAIAPPAPRGSMGA